MSTPDSDQAQLLETELAAGTVVAAPPPDLFKRSAGSRRDRWTMLGARIALLAVVIGLWQLTSQQRWIDPLLIGQPSGIAENLYHGVIVSPWSYLGDLGYTMLETAISFLLGTALGLLVGLLFGIVPWLERYSRPFFGALNSVPRVALAPLFVLWFGLGVNSKIALAVSLVFFIVVEGAVAGIRSVERDWLTLARMLGASRARVFISITLPSALPTLFSTLRITVVYALLGVITGEIIAAEHGLGQRLEFFANSFQTNGLFAVLVLLGLVGGILAWLMTVIEHRLTRWK